MRRGRGLLIVAGVILALFIVVQVTGPQPINWKPSYSHQHKAPFGAYILHERLGDIFPGQPVQVMDKGAYEMLEEWPEDSPPVNYLIIQDVFETDHREAAHLMEFVEEGNNVFISANQFAGSFADTFEVSTNHYGDYEIGLDNEYFLTPEPDSIKKFYFLKDGLKHYVLTHYPRTSDMEELGGVLGEEDPNFVRIGHGKGSFYLHSAPMLLTNYNMLYGPNHEYVERALSKLPSRPIVWDEYYKPQRVRAASPLKYVLQSKGLRWAWLILLPSLILYILFAGKRRQRIIPVMAPPKNDSLEFTETIGRLYWEHGDHLDLARKKARYLMEHIRVRHHMDTQIIDRNFIERLSLRTGVPVAQVSSLMHKALQLHQMTGLSGESLLTFVQEVDDFYERSK